METDPTRMCELLVGLPDVSVLGVEEGDVVVVHVELRTTKVGCPSCGVVAWLKDRSAVELVDLPAFGRPARLVWRRHRWRCPDEDCPVGSFTAQDDRIAPPRGAMTDRAGRWATKQVGQLGRTVAEVADDLGCDWHTVNDAVMAYGAALVDDDPDRIGPVTALGLDETLFCRSGRWRTRQWCTSIVDVGPGQVRLLDVVPGRSAAAPTAWLEARPEAWRAAIRFGVLDLSGPYRKTFEDALGHATQVADPFHLIKLGNSKLDECRRRVQNETLGHRGRKGDPLYRARRLLTKAHERLEDRGEQKLLGLLSVLATPGARCAWPGTPRRCCARSTRSTIPSSPPIPLRGTVDAAPPERRSAMTQERGYSATREQLLTRLARVEGQVRGVARMVEDDRYCIDVLTQINAVRAALDKVALGLLDGHARHCLAGGQGGPTDADGQVRELMGAVGRMLSR